MCVVITKDDNVLNLLTKELKNIGLDIDLSSLDEDATWDEIEATIIDEIEQISEIIYFDNAIDFLKEEDPSLRVSLEIAADQGYDIRSSNFNSELLATLLNTADNMLLWDESYDDLFEIYVNYSHLKPNSSWSGDSSHDI